MISSVYKMATLSENTNAVCERLSRMRILFYKIEFYFSGEKK